MKSISDFDPNFHLPESIPQGTRFYNPYAAPFSLFGAQLDDQGIPCRLPTSLLPECSEGVRHLAYHLAGACVRFSTDADQIAVIWELSETENMPHFAASGQSGLELFEETGNGCHEIKNLIPAMDNGHGCRKKQSFFTRLPGGLRHYALYLPLYNGLCQMWIGFPPDAQVLPGRTPMIEKPIVFYGSSITQGGCAGKAGSCYSSILCRRLDAAQINLGFSGNGRGEASMARYIASLPMSLFVLDYDHNAPTAEHLRKTHETFFRIIRDAQPDLPVVMISKPDFDVDPKGSAIRRRIIQETYEHALSVNDPHIVFVDGEKLFGSSDRDMCTVDGCHPTDLGFLRIADYLEPILRKYL